MGSCGRQVRVTFATKITKVIIGGRGAEEGVRRPRLEHFGWQNVKQVSGCLQSFDPVRWKKRSLEQKGAHNVITGMDDALGLTVLGGSVRAQRRASVMTTSWEPR